MQAANIRPLSTPARESAASTRPIRTLHVAGILAIAIAAAYFNCLNNAFQLDDYYGLQNNEWIRSLRNIPRFFTDPFTLTSTKSNADYRPILQITYALNYAISGYAPWSWHVVNLVLHLIV